MTPGLLAMTVLLMSLDVIAATLSAPAPAKMVVVGSTGAWRWAAAIAVLVAGCSEGYGFSDVQLSVTADGTQTVEVQLGRCMGDRPSSLEVTESADEVRVRVDGDWSDAGDCAFSDSAVLAAPLGDRSLVLTDPGHRYRACADSPGTAADADLGSQRLCRDGEGSADAVSLWSAPPAAGTWVVEDLVPPVWFELTHLDDIGSFLLTGSAGCNRIEITVVADRGGAWLAPVSSMTERECADPARQAESHAADVDLPVSIDLDGSTLTLGGVSFRRVADAPDTDTAASPPDAEEQGRWELRSIAASGELPATAGCWWLGRWDGALFVELGVLTDGEAFGASQHVVFADEQAAIEAGAPCGQTADVPERIGLPIGVARRGAYEVCASAGAACRRFTIVEAGAPPPPTIVLRAELAGIVDQYDGFCRAGRPEADGAAVILQDPLDNRCFELARPRDVTRSVAGVEGLGGLAPPEIVLDEAGSAALRGLITERRAAVLLIGDRVVATVTDPGGRIRIDSYFADLLSELVRTLDS